MKWISVKDELPPQNERVIFNKYDGRKNVVMNFIALGCTLNNSWFYDDNDRTRVDPKYGVVTHWMPLPRPPAEENK